MTNLATATAPAPAPAPAGIGDNSTDKLQDLFDQLDEFAEAEAAGLGSRCNAAVALTSAAYEGVISESDAEALYDAYATKLAKSAAKRHLVVESNIRSRTAQVSKFRAFIRLGMLPDPVDGREILERARAIAEQVAASGTKILSPFEALRTVAVAQNKEPGEVLTDEQISGLVSKKEPKKKDAIAKLVAVYKSAYRLDEELSLPGTKDAVNGLAAAIADLGGEIPLMTKEDKQIVALAEAAAKFGLVLSSVNADAGADAGADAER